MKFVVIDTETNNLPDRGSFENVRLVQIGIIIAEKRNYFNILSRYDVIIRPDNFRINNSEIHGITNEIAESKGKTIDVIAAEIMPLLQGCELIVAHNVDFDKNVLLRAFRDHTSLTKFLNETKTYCTMKNSTNIVCLPSVNSIYGGYKYPKLGELYRHFFGCELEVTHNAIEDVQTAYYCYASLINGDAYEFM